MYIITYFTHALYALSYEKEFNFSLLQTNLTKTSEIYIITNGFTVGECSLLNKLL